MTISDQHWALVNEMMPKPGGDPYKPYQLGIASAAALQAGVEPTRNYFQNAMQAETLLLCVRFCEAWVNHQTAGPARPFHADRS